MKDSESQLRHLKEDEIVAALSQVDDAALLRYLRSKYVRIGDAAFTILRRRKCHRSVAVAIVGGAFKSKPAKIRAANLLKFDGCSAAWALSAYWHLVADKDQEVAVNALFGIVFAQARSYLGELRALLKEHDDRSLLGEKLMLAIRAIEVGDPYIYSPNFMDRRGVWANASKTGGSEPTGSGC